MSDERCEKTELLQSQCSHCLGQDTPVKRIPSVEIRASELFDYAASNPEWTKDMACHALGWSDHTLTTTIRCLRGILAEDDINVVVLQKGGEFWYKLAGDLESVMPWATVRLRSLEAQLGTLANVAKSICNATNANSRDGRKARLIAAQINILSLQLNSLEG